MELYNAYSNYQEFCEGFYMCLHKYQVSPAEYGEAFEAGWYAAQGAYQLEEDPETGLLEVVRL